VQEGSDGREAAAFDEDLIARLRAMRERGHWLTTVENKFLWNLDQIAKHVRWAHARQHDCLAPGAVASRRYRESWSDELAAAIGESDQARHRRTMDARMDRHERSRMMVAAWEIRRGATREEAEQIIEAAQERIAALEQPPPSSPPLPRFADDPGF